MPKSCPAFQASRPLPAGQASPWLHPGTDPARFPRPFPAGDAPATPPEKALDPRAWPQASRPRPPAQHLGNRTGCSRPVADPGRPLPALDEPGPETGQKAALKWRQNRPFSANPERIKQRADSRAWYSDQRAARSPRPAARQVKGGRLKERFAKGVPCK